MDAEAERAPPPPGIGDPAARAAGRQGLPRRQVVLTMAGVMLGLFLAALDQTVVGTAMPRIIADLGGFDRFTWVTTSYLVASTTAVPIVGGLTDLYGRKAFYLAGIGVFLIGSVLSGLSQTMNELIAFRAVQGLGGGVLLALAFVTVGDLFSPAERGKYQGIVAAVFGLSSVVGPTLGGFITDNLSWHWIFYVNVPLGIPAVLVLVRFFPATRRVGPRPRLDVLGIVTLVLAVVPLMLGLSWGGVQYEWGSPQVVGALALAAMMAAAFVATEHRAADPIMPLRIYRNRIVSVSLLAVFGTGFGMFGGIIFIPLFFQGVLGASATSSGSFLTPMMMGMVTGAVLAGQALSRLGGHYRLQGFVGVAIMTAGMFLVSRMTAQTGYGRAVLSIVVMGFGLGNTFPVFTIAVQNAVPQSLLGVATSATQFYRSIGGAVGLAVLGSYMAGRFSTKLTASLTPEIREAVPAEQLAALSSNPQSVVNPDALASLKAALGEAGDRGGELAQDLLAMLRESLASAITDVFLVTTVIALAAMLVTLFLKEIPLRGTGPTGGGKAGDDSDQT